MPIAHDDNTFFEVIRDNPMNGMVLVEGDSWTSHPFISNLTMQLEMLSKHQYNILDLSYPGHTAAAIFDRDGPQLKQFKRTVHGNRDGYKFGWILLSAGGNDIVGPEILAFVNAKTDGAYGRELLNSQYERILDERIIPGYERALDVCEASTINADTPVVAHVYSYLPPRKKGTRLPVFGPNLGEGWIARHLENLGITDPVEQADVVMGMLDVYHEKLSSLSDTYDNFTVVDTRKLLSKQGQPDEKWWSDEIHPTGEGFAKVAKEIMKAAP